MPLATGVMLVGCFNPPELEDSTAGSSTGPGPTTGVDGSSSGMSPETTVSSLDGSTGSPETTSGPGTTDGGSSESTAAGPQPDIEVSIDGMVIPSGGTYPIADTVDVGALGAVVTVTIENVGDDTLTLSGLTPGGPDVSHFAVDIMGVSPSLGVGESTSFGLRFAPINGGRKGLLVSVGSDDPDEDPYEITFDAQNAAPETGSRGKAGGIRLPRSVTNEKSSETLSTPGWARSIDERRVEPQRPTWRSAAPGRRGPAQRRPARPARSSGTRVARWRR